MIKPGIAYRWTHRPLENLSCLWDWCLDFVRRGLNGFAPSDTWSWDSYMAEVNVAALKYLKRHGHTHPMFPDLSEDHWENRWNEILDKMIAGFQASLDIGECDWSNREQLEALEKIEREGLGLYVEYFNALWD